ncbi:MAG: 3-phosphoshikimate 1-carboxyvinyltransferase [Acidobacteria bacterium]|nr:3-phosphoshikimate 1-carboxyvinyltransferase [Acidobacteriota bacterium]
MSGRIAVPPSKSLTQRALVTAACAGGGSRVVRPLDAEDPRLLAAALTATGFRLGWAGDEVLTSGRDAVDGAKLFLGNNGTGARFLLAQLASLPGEWRLDGVSRLRERPFGALVRALVGLGADVTPESPGEPRLPLRVRGRSLVGGRVHLDPSESSQFVSALLLLGPCLRDGVEIVLEAAPPSRPYVALTAEVLAAFGGRCESAEDGRIVRAAPGGLRPATFVVEGDWSAAAFPLAAAAVAGGEVEVAGVRRDSHQGDAVVAGLLAEAGCRVRATTQGVALAGPATRPVVADLRDTPDLFPALAVVTAVVGGRLTGLSGLAAKESDRLEVMVAHLQALGFRVGVEDGTFTSRGGLKGIAAPVGALAPAGDHRVAMALAVAGAVVPGVRVADPGCVAKSWPGFWVRWDELVGVAP